MLVLQMRVCLSVCLSVLSQGALVDQYGPGTAFHHFKQQRLRRREDSSLIDDEPDPTGQSGA